MYKEIGLLEESNYALSLKEKLVMAFKRECIDDQEYVIGRTQTGLAMALYHGMFDEENKVNAVNNLLELIKEKDDHFDIGVLGNRVLFRVLADNGHIDLAYKLITNKTFPSFSYQLQFGATSLWESFCEMNDNFELKSAANLIVLSLNHHFWGDISSFFIEYILGIKIDYSNKDTPVIIKPTFVEAIDKASGYHELKEGKVFVSYEIINDIVNLEVCVPTNTNVLVNCPNLDRMILTSGKYNFTFPKQ